MAKRNAGEGTIFQRQDGRWCATLSLGWEGGKRRRHYFYGTTAQEVQEARDNAKNDLRRGLPIAVEHPTVERFLTDWLATIKASVGVRSYERYEGIVRLHLIPVLGRVKLEKLTPAHVQQLLDSKLAGGLSPRSVQGVRIVLRAALKQATRWDIVPRNVADLVDGPKVPGREMQVLTPEQARTFLTTAQPSRLYPLYLLALSTGMRRGELLALKWTDIDLEAGKLSVRRSLGRSITQGVIIAEPKTRQARRSIRLSAPVLSALKAHRVRQAKERLAAGPAWHDEGFLFTTSIGTTLDPRDLDRDFKQALSSAGLPPVRFHDLRHSAATIALSQGVHPKIVSEMLGHSRISLTLDTYSHSLPTLQVEAADKMADALFGGAKGA